MPQEPKRRHSKARKRTRRASIFLESTKLISCKNCAAKVISHQVCPECGFYDGVSVNQKSSVKVIKA